jgi:hypothetical protein
MTEVAKRPFYGYTTVWGEKKGRGPVIPGRASLEAHGVGRG